MLTPAQARAGGRCNDASDALTWLQPGFSQFLVLISKMCALGVHVVRTCMVCCDATLHDVIMDVETGQGW